MELWPVYVPSKGRSQLTTTHRVLSMVPDWRWTYVVEPQEQRAYAARFGADRLLVLPRNDPGLPFVRQWLVELTASAEVPWCWMWDDDVYHVCRRVGRSAKQIKSAEELRAGVLEAQALIEHSGAVLGALEYRQFCWSTDAPVAFDSYADVTVALAPQRLLDLGVRYDPALALKEDRDYALQCVTARAHVARVLKYGFSCAALKLDGGLSYLYGQSEAEAAAVRRFCAKWPAYARPVTKDDRVDVRVDWRLAARQRGNDLFTLAGQGG